MSNYEYNKDEPADWETKKMDEETEWQKHQRQIREQYLKELAIEIDEEEDAYNKNGTLLNRIKSLVDGVKFDLDKILPDNNSEEDNDARRGLLSTSFTDSECEKHTPHENAWDSVEKPKHYNVHPSGIECIEITKHMDFCLGNAVKYLWRVGIKSEETSVEDLEKAIWYINKKIELLNREW